MLSRADPLPHLARGLFIQADEIIERCQLTPGTSVHVVRSYLAPLGCFVADRLGSAWTTLDLDDDDETFALALDPSEAAAYHRVVATFAPHFDAISAASLDEASVLGRRHGLSIRTLVNAVDTSRSSEHTVVKTSTLLFVGNLTYTPNVDAAEFLAYEVLPMLRARIPGPVELLIIGAHDENGPVGKIGRIDGVTVTGFVDDLEPFYARASAVVAPLRLGAGTRIKLLEAFAYRVPVIATHIAVAGLDVETGVHFLQAETADSFAVAAARLVRDHDFARAMTASAFDYVRRAHSPGRFDEDLAALFEDAREQGARRLRKMDSTNAPDEPREDISRTTT
ncbi:MAG: glycosyltransferase family 4 protein [Acidimicrobiales bacterium]